MLLGTLYNQGHRDPETLGIYGRTWMDRHAQSKDVLDLKKSRDLYAEAFEGATDDYYTGINAAAKSVMLGTGHDVAKGNDYAKRVEAIVGAEKKPGDYWHTATVAEVQLLQRNYKAAGERYADAVALAPKEKGSHETSWKQACRLLQKLQASQDEVALVEAAFGHLQSYEKILEVDAT